MSNKSGQWWGKLILQGWWAREKSNSRILHVGMGRGEGGRGEETTKRFVDGRWAHVGTVIYQEPDRNLVGRVVTEPGKVSSKCISFSPDSTSTDSSILYSFLLFPRRNPSTPFFFSFFFFNERREILREGTTKERRFFETIVAPDKKEAETGREGQLFRRGERVGRAKNSRHTGGRAPRRRLLLLEK